MLNSFKGARLGIFVFLATIFIILTIFFIGSKDSLFVDTILVKTTFSRIEGLRTGAPVRLSGYTIGTVNSIQLADDTTGNVIVTMDIEKSVINFIRLDSEASIETEGLVGKKIVAITPGSTQYELVKDGGKIKSKSPISMTEIIGETQSIISYVKNMTKDFSEIVSKINSGNGTIGKLVNDDELYKSTVNITQSADRSLNVMTARMDEVTGLLNELGGGASSIFDNIDSVAVTLKNVIARVENGEGILGALVADSSSYDSLRTVITNLVQTTDQALEGARGFNENMEALKHNWLFKTYFEERGYWNRAEYEKELEQKLEELQKQNALLEQRLLELKSKYDTVGKKD